MIKIIALLFIVFVSVTFLLNCGLYNYDEYWDIEYDIPEIDYTDHPQLDGTTIVFNDEVVQIVWWVSKYIMYTKDEVLYNDGEYWATPEETYKSQRGDCEDHALLSLYLLHRDLGLNPRLVCGWYKDLRHAWIELDGEWYEATSGRKVTDSSNYREFLTYEYNEALGIAARVRTLNVPFVVGGE